MRKFLDSLNLEKETLEAIMGEYGKKIKTSNDTISKLNGEITSLNDNIKTLTDANNELKKVDVNALEKQIEQLKEQAVQSATKHQEELNGVKFDNALSLAVERSKTVDPIGLKAHLDTSKLTYNADNDSIDGFDEQIKEIQTNYSYLFNGSKGQASPQGGLGSGKTVGSLLDALKEKY